MALMAQISDELLAAYHGLYETWLLHTAPAEIGVPGYNGLTLEDTEEMEQAAYRIQYLLSEGPSPSSCAGQGDRQ
jgi:hypothetical protein